MKIFIKDVLFALYMDKEKSMIRSLHRTNRIVAYFTAVAVLTGIGSGTGFLHQRYLTRERIQNNKTKLAHYNHHFTTNVIIDETSDLKRTHTTIQDGEILESRAIPIATNSPPQEYHISQKYQTSQYVYLHKVNTIRGSQNNAHVQLLLYPIDLLEYSRGAISDRLNEFYQFKSANIRSGRFFNIHTLEEIVNPTFTDVSKNPDIKEGYFIIGIDAK